MYFPVALLGYIFIGDSVNSNIFLSLKPGPAVYVAMIFQIFNLMGSYLITLSPIFLLLEDLFKFPTGKEILDCLNTSLIEIVSIVKLSSKQELPVKLIYLCILYFVVVYLPQL